MWRDFLWFQPLPKNFDVEKRRLKLWRRWGAYYRCTAEYKLLERIELVRARRSASSVSDRANANLHWLLSFRREIRCIPIVDSLLGRRGAVEAIRYYMAFCPHEMIPICFWLIGRCSERFHSYPLSKFCCRQSSQSRKHLAKALRRLQERWLLENLAGLYPEDTRLQRIATDVFRFRSFRERLAAYASGVDDSQAGEAHTPSQMPFWSLEPEWERTPPKSIELIRRILRRIQHWVHWGVS